MMPGLAASLDPADRERIVQRLTELRVLARLAEEPPLPPDPQDGGQDDDDAGGADAAGPP